jgi:hypothetical protein
MFYFRKAVRRLTQVIAALTPVAFDQQCLPARGKAGLQQMQELDRFWSQYRCFLAEVGRFRVRWRHSANLL